MDKDGNTIPYRAPIHRLWRFGCFVGGLVLGALRRDKLGPRSKPGCMIIGYANDSTTTWKLWDPEFNSTKKPICWDYHRRKCMWRC